MTTIAWDGKTLAADSLGDKCGWKIPSQKIIRLRDGRLYGTAGAFGQCLAVADWLNHRDGGAPEAEDAGGIIIGLDGHAYAVERHATLIRLPKTAAAGSGRDFALAAMRCGKTAAEAVKIAIEFDVYSGGRVITATL